MFISNFTDSSQGIKKFFFQIICPPRVKGNCISLPKKVRTIVLYSIGFSAVGYKMFLLFDNFCLTKSRLTYIIYKYI